MLFFVIIKKLTIATFIFVIAFHFIFAGASQAQTSPYVSITSPNGGQVYTEGQSVRITWDSNSSTNCSLYYITPEGGASMAYYIGGASASAGFLDWNASRPSQEIGNQQEKVQIACNGLPVDYSDDYFTVVGPVVTPTVTPTPTPPPVCNRSPQLSYSDTNPAYVYPGQSAYNQVVVTNPNDPECGWAFYGLSRGVPGELSLDIQNYLSVAPGETATAPFTIAATTSAEYKTYSYWIAANDFGGGTSIGVNNYVTVIPRCDLPAQASLLQPSQNSMPGVSVGNTLVLTNPNQAQCGAKTYVYSRSYPGGWNMTIQPNVTVNSGETVSVPFSLTVGGTAAMGTYDYNFLVYNSWVDGSGQTQVNGTINVLDGVSPIINITQPTNNSLISRNKSIQVTANATDNVSVSKVEFYVNGTLLCTDTTALYNCSFKSANRKNVVYTIVAKAYDTANNVSASTVKVTTK